MPFVIAQIGILPQRITPGNFIFRSREFEQMEGSTSAVPVYGAALLRRVALPTPSWYADLGIADAVSASASTPRTIARTTREAVACEFEYPFGWNETRAYTTGPTSISGGTASFSGKDLRYHDTSGERFLPY